MKSFSLAARRSGVACTFLVSAAFAADPSPPSAASAPVAREVTLAELLDFAVERAPSNVLAQRRRGAGAAARTSAGALFESNPTLTFAMGPRVAGPNGRSMDYQVGLAQPVEIAGQRGGRKQAAERLDARLSAEAQAVSWQVRTEVTAAFHKAVVAANRVSLARRRLRFAEEVLKATRDRVTAGDATAIDARLSETALAEARQDLSAKEGELVAARLELCLVSGWSMQAPPVVPSRLEPPRPLPSLEELIATIGRNHPELVARRAATAEARARTELADREAWPTPVLGVQFTREGSVGSPANDILLGIIELPLPLWQQNQAERANARAEEATLRAEQTLEAQVLALRVARAHARLAAAIERIAIYSQDVSPALEDGLALVERGLRAGEIPLSQVFDARERFLEAEETMLDAHADYYAALAELQAAAGGDVGPRGEGGARRDGKNDRGAVK